MNPGVTIPLFHSRSQTQEESNISIARFGALLGFTSALAYGALFSLYASARVGWAALNAPAEGAAFTLISNALSLVVASMFFAVLCGLPAAVVQSGVLTLSAALNRRWNQKQSPRTGVWIGTGSALAAALVLHGLVAAAPPAATRLLWESGYLFWSGLPTLVFLGLNAIVGAKITATIAQRGV